MNSIKDKFVEELLSLEKLLLFFNQEQELLKYEDNTNELLIKFKCDFSNFYSQKRIFNYNSLIISLYGYFEKFIENILIEYIDKVNGIYSTYKSIPRIISKNHLKLSLELLEKVQNPYYSGSLNKEIVIQRLHECINLNENYQLNKEAFSQHSANFRRQVIDNVFYRVGIDSISNQVRKNNSFIEYIKNKYELTDIKDLGNDDIHSYLNDLAERRNEVAHGVPSEILSNDILIEYIKYFKELAEAITEVVYKNINRLDLNENGVFISNITDCFHGGSIICFKTNRNKFSKGDLIYGVSENSIHVSQILNIQLNGTDLDQTDESIDYEIGVFLDKPFNRNFKIYIINATRQHV